MELFKPGKQYDFMSIRKYWIGFSLLSVVASLFFVLVWPTPTYGTDFKGGTEVEVAFLKQVDAGKVRAAVEQAGYAAPDIVQVNDPANPNRFLIRVQEVTTLDDEKKAAVQSALCYAHEGAELPEDRCPHESRATEVKFSPGGDKIFIRYDSEPAVDHIREQLKSVAGLELRAGAQNPQVVNPRDHKVEVQLKSKGDQLMDSLGRELGADVVPDNPLRVEWVGPKAGKQLRDAAIKSVAIAIIFIMAYVAFRFDLRFAPAVS